MNDEYKTSDVLIIGAGLTGLVAARVLQNQGATVTVLDKEPFVGGRLATCILTDGVADLGAQYFTAETMEFQQWVERWIQADLVYTWSDEEWSSGSLRQGSPTRQSHFAVRGGMQNLADYLAQDLHDVRLNIHVVSVVADANEWLAQDDYGSVHAARILVFALPVPYATVILDSGVDPLSRSDRAVLERIVYSPSLAAAFRIDGEIQLPNPGVLHRPFSAIRWIADNQRKGISRTHTLTVQTSPEYAIQRWDEDDERILRHMEANLFTYLTPGTQILEAQLRRWSYALPQTLYPERYFRAEVSPPLLFAGDAFGGQGVEGAVLSGIAAGNAVVGSARKKPS